MAITLREIRILITPGRRETFARRARDAPVRADDAVIVILVAQQADLEGAVSAADLVAKRTVIAPGDGVRRHDGARFLRLARQLQAALDEWRELRLEVATGIDGVLAVLRVRLAAALADAVTGPVLHHRVDAVLAPAFVLAVFLRGLLAVNRRLCHVARKRGILAKRAVVARPARVGREVDLRRKACAEAEQTEFLRRDFAELACNLRVERRRDAEVVRPARNAFLDFFQVNAVRARIAARIGARVRRDSERQALGVALERVVPFRRRLDRCRLVGIEHRAHMVFAQHLLLFIIELGLEVALMRAVEHQARDVFRRELRREVFCALLRRQAPVFVRGELAVAVHVLERLAIDRQDLDARVLFVAERCAALVLDARPAVGRLRLRIVFLCGRKALRAHESRQHHSRQSNITFLRHLEIPLPNHQKKNCAWKR